MKILSPVGNFDSLKMAVFNGADEVYLGINNFNARNNIDGFDITTLKSAVDFAHIFGVKINLAINILFADDELQDALDTIANAYNLGVDCFIIQDLGLASLVHTNYPEIEIHASTQMGIHNLEGVKAIEPFGFKRVVLARETPISEIKRIKQNTNLEIEYFAQGALCVAFSGNCYLSSYLCSASGNRGKCKQLCRLPYTLEFNGKKLKTGTLLSAKDFNLIDRLEELKAAGVDVIKIEGRARRPFYVASATRQYYNALNGIKTNPDELMLGFNRLYTAGYFDGNGNIISSYHNHIGINIGKVEKVNLGKKFNEVFFSSNRDLSEKSTFKIFSNGVEKSTLSAYDLTKLSNGKYKTTTTQKVTVGDHVHLIIDAKLEDETLQMTKKKPVKIKLSMNANSPIKAEFEIDKKSECVLGEVLLPAQNRPLEKEQIVASFKKHELFDAEIEFETFESVFLPTKLINEFRRAVFETIETKITQKHRKNVQKIKLKTNLNINPLCDFQIISDAHSKLTATNIIYAPEVYDVKDIESLKNTCVSQHKTLFLNTPNFALEKDIEFLKDIILKTNLPIVINNYYALNLTNNYVVGAGMNIYNTITANIYNKPFITAESDIAQKINYPVMTLRHCPMKSHLNADCSKCPYKQGYTYKMDNGKTLLLSRQKLSTCTFYLSLKG